MSLTRHGAAGERVAVNLHEGKIDERGAATVTEVVTDPKIFPPSRRNVYAHQSGSSLSSRIKITTLRHRTSNHRRNVG